MSYLTLDTVVIHGSKLRAMAWICYFLYLACVLCGDSCDKFIDALFITYFSSFATGMWNDYITYYIREIFIRVIFHGLKVSINTKNFNHNDNYNSSLYQKKINKKYFTQYFITFHQSGMMNLKNSHWMNFNSSIHNSDTLVLEE